MSMQIHDMIQMNINVIVSSKFLHTYAYSYTVYTYVLVRYNSSFVHVNIN